MDTEQFEELWHLHAPFVRACISRFVFDEFGFYDVNGINDLFSQVFKSLLNVCSSDEIKSPKAFIATIARRRINDFFRKEGKRLKLTVGVELADEISDPTVSDPSDILVRTERKESVQKALSELNGLELELVWKVFYEDLSVRDIAKMEDIPQSTLYHQLRKIKDKLRASPHLKDFRIEVNE